MRFPWPRKTFTDINTTVFLQADFAEIDGYESGYDNNHEEAATAATAVAVPVPVTHESQDPSSQDDYGSDSDDEQGEQGAGSRPLSSKDIAADAALEPTADGASETYDEDDAAEDMDNQQAETETEPSTNTAAELAAEDNEVDPVESARLRIQARMADRQKVREAGVEQPPLEDGVSERLVASASTRCVNVTVQKHGHPLVITALYTGGYSFVTCFIVLPLGEDTVLKIFRM